MTDGRLMVKKFNNDNSGEFCAKTKQHKNSPELSLLKFLPLTYVPSQPLLGRHLGFHIFFHHSLFEGRTLFLQLGCFGLDKYINMHLSVYDILTIYKHV